MGIVTLNGAKLEGNFEKPSVLETVAEIEENHIDKEHIITDVVVDGKSIQDFTLIDGTLIPFSPDSDLKIITKPLKIILSSSIDEFCKYLERLIPGLQQVAQLFRSDNVQDANKLYVEAIDGIRVMIELIQGMSGNDSIDFNTPRIDGRSLIVMTDDLKSVLQHLVAAQANGENDKVAHFLETSLSTELEAWYQVLPGIKENLQ